SYAFCRQAPPSKGGSSKGCRAFRTSSADPASHFEDVNASTSCELEDQSVRRDEPCLGLNRRCDDQPVKRIRMHRVESRSIDSSFGVERDDEDPSTPDRVADPLIHGWMHLHGLLPAASPVVRLDSDERSFVSGDGRQQEMSVLGGALEPAPLF